MIEALTNRGERRRDIGKVLDPPEFLLDLTADVNCDAERMSMQSRTLVVLRDEGQAMGGLYREFLEDFQVSVSERKNAMRPWCGMAFSNVAPRAGLEPATNGLTVRRSTN